MEKDYYKILEVPEDATDDVIKKSFRKLAKKYHPDTNGGNRQAAERFQEINEAYSVLGDEEKRKSYDESRKYGAGSASQTGNASKAQGTRKAAGANPFAGFTAQNFKMDFGDMMFDELDKEKQKKTAAGQVNYADVSEQFASFFGFRPKS